MSLGKQGRHYITWMVHVSLGKQGPGWCTCPWESGNAMLYHLDGARVLGKAGTPCCITWMVLVSLGKQGPGWCTCPRGSRDAIIIPGWCTCPWGSRDAIISPGWCSCPWESGNAMLYHLDGARVLGKAGTPCCITWMVHVSLGKRERHVVSPGW